MATGRRSSTLPMHPVRARSVRMRHPVGFMCTVCSRRGPCAKLRDQVHYNTQGGLQGGKVQPRRCPCCVAPQCPVCSKPAACVQVLSLPRAPQTLLSSCLVSHRCELCDLACLFMTFVSVDAQLWQRRARFRFVCRRSFNLCFPRHACSMVIFTLSTGVKPVLKTLYNHTQARAFRTRVWRTQLPDYVACSRLRTWTGTRSCPCCCPVAKTT